MARDDCPYVSRGGLKLAAALDAFALDVAGLTCADFGSHAGGFVDCLLQRGARHVFAVDTGYGVLDYKLRKDDRVTVCERTNAMHFDCPTPCDLITIDVGWTPQRLILPAAQRGLAAGGRVVSLVKPQYEAPKAWLTGGVVPAERLAGVLAQCRQDVTQLGWQVLDDVPSPICGHGGNRETLWLLGRDAT